MGSGSSCTSERRFRTSPLRGGIPPRPVAPRHLPAAVRASSDGLIIVRAHLARQPPIHRLNQGCAHDGLPCGIGFAAGEPAHPVAGRFKVAMGCTLDHTVGEQRGQRLRLGRGERLGKSPRRRPLRSASGLPRPRARRGWTASHAGRRSFSRLRWRATARPLVAACRERRSFAGRGCVMRPIDPHPTFAIPGRGRSTLEVRRPRQAVAHEH
jgi:hypothetical protein